MDLGTDQGKVIDQVPIEGVNEENLIDGIPSYLINPEERRAATELSEIQPEVIQAISEEPVLTPTQADIVNQGSPILDDKQVIQDEIDRQDSGITKRSLASSGLSKVGNEYVRSLQEAEELKNKAQLAAAQVKSNALDEVNALHEQQMLDRKAEKEMLQNQIDEIERSQKEIDPRRYFANQSTLGKIAMAIGLVASGALLGTTGRDPYGDFLDKAIQQDIDAQKANLAKGNEKKSKLYKRMLDITKSNEAAEAAVKTLMLRKAEEEARGRVLKVQGDAVAKAKAKQALFAVRQKIEQSDLNFQKFMTQKNIKERELQIKNKALLAKKSKPISAEKGKILSQMRTANTAMEESIKLFSEGASTIAAEKTPRFSEAGQKLEYAKEMLMRAVTGAAIRPDEKKDMMKSLPSPYLPTEKYVEGLRWWMKKAKERIDLQLAGEGEESKEAYNKETGFKALGK